MIPVLAMEMLGMLVLGLVVLRAVWLAMHPGAHHAIQRAGHWSAEADRVMHHVGTHSRG